jgi:hypothetical protein
MRITAEKVLLYGSYRNATCREGLGCVGGARERASLCAANEISHSGLIPVGAFERSLEPGPLQLTMKNLIPFMPCNAGGRK